MRFVKMHGLGNDFVVVDGPVDLTTAEIALICDRHRGIGADGLLAVGFDGRVSMGYWNADGSRAEMCGNGLRCVARHAYERDPTSRRFVVETPVGPRRVEIGDGDLVSVEIGEPVVSPRLVVAGWELIPVSVGNPHAVALVPDPGTVDVPDEGRSIDADPAFPDGVNVEFVSILPDEAVEMRVWERGVGETLACGSGMVAAAAVARSLEGWDEVRVEVPGGEGRVDFRQGVAWLTGPAVTVFAGEWPDGQRTRRKTETTFPSTLTPPSSSSGG